MSRRSDERAASGAPAPGAVYLAASSHEGTLRAMASRILASAERRPLHIAVTYAAAGGPMVARMNEHLARLFGGAEIHRFTVAGELPGAGSMGPEEAAATIEAADLIFIGGGDPVLGARRLVDSGADVWLRGARARGTPCLGISAGAIMLASWWAEWPDHPAHGAPHDGGELVRCTGVAAALVVDCHAEDDDWSELRLVQGMLRGRLAGKPQPRFLGLLTGRGIIVEADGSTENVAGAPFELPP
jgi:hypothetical protein